MQQVLTLRTPEERAATQPPAVVAEKPKEQPKPPKVDSKQKPKENVKKEADKKTAPNLGAAVAGVCQEVKIVLEAALKPPAMEKKAEEKDRDQVKAEREAKRLAKKNKKGAGADTPSANAKPDNKPATTEKVAQVAPAKKEQPQKQKPKKESEPKATAPQPAPAASPGLTKSATDTEISAKLENLHLSEKAAKEKAEKPALTKAERRAIQEAQRAAKAKAQAEKAAVAAKPAAAKKPSEPAKSPVKAVAPKAVSTHSHAKKPATHRVKLFSHLYLEKQSPEELLQETASSEVEIHPAIIQLGVQQAKGTIVGANSRCIAFLNAIKMAIADFVPPPQKILSRSLEAMIQASIVYLQKCRPISVSMANALKAVKGQINHLPDNETEEQHKETLAEFIDTYIRDQIEKAAVAISKKVQEKICTGDVILTYGCSSLIKHILDEAHRRSVDFRVIVVDSCPLNEGQEMLRRLTAEGIQCSCVGINAVSFVMPEVTKVLVGAHALLANGYVMSRTGTAQVAMVAKSYNVPVLVCCETHKFSERVQTDAFVYNEIGDPNDLVRLDCGGYLKGWETIPHLTPLHLYYDITPPELVAAVVTEVAILPCTSVPVILRIKPTEVWY